MLLKVIPSIILYLLIKTFSLKQSQTQMTYGNLFFTFFTKKVKIKSKKSKK